MLQHTQYVVGKPVSAMVRVAPFWLKLEYDDGYWSTWDGTLNTCI